MLGLRKPPSLLPPLADVAGARALSALNVRNGPFLEVTPGT